MQEWEGVCGRVWSVGVRREKEPRKEGEEEGFHGVPGTPIAPRKVASCQGVRSPVWEQSSSLQWLLASNPTPGCRSDFYHEGRGGFSPLIQALSQLLMFLLMCSGVVGHRTVFIGRQLWGKEL